MTLTVNTIHDVNEANRPLSMNVPRASVWDLDAVHATPANSRHVRTLASDHRTNSPYVSASPAPAVRPRSFEQRRESGKVTLLGLAVGAVIVIGTVVGVNEGSSHQGPGQYETVTAVTAK